MQNSTLGHKKSSRRSSAENPQTAIAQQMKDVEELTNELKRLLVHHESMLDEEGIRHEVEVLERWMESCRRGLAAAHKISQTGTAWLSDLRNHLKLAVEERHRLETEGGNPANQEQAEKTDELLRTLQHIEEVLPNVEQLFQNPEESFH